MVCAIVVIQSDVLLLRSEVLTLVHPGAVTGFTWKVLKEYRFSGEDQDQVS